MEATPTDCIKEESPKFDLIRSIFLMSDQLTNMGAKSRKSKYMKWLNEEN